MQAVRTLWRFASSHKSITATIAVLAAVLGAVLYVPKAGPAPLLVPVAAFVVVLNMLARYERVLGERMKADNTDFMWNVHANGVHSGVISDAEYASIRRDAYLSWRTYGMQIGNLVHILVRAVDYLFVALPLTVFWAIVLAFVYAREDLAECVNYVLTRSPSELAAMMPHVGGLLVFVGILCVIGHLFTGRSFGFRNVFEDTVTDAVRRKVRCAAIGPISLSRLVDGGVVTSRERELLFPHDGHCAHAPKSKMGPQGDLSDEGTK